MEVLYVRLALRKEPGLAVKLMRPVVSISNNFLLVTINYFLLCMMKHRKAPDILRMDCGTENICCEDIQVFFIGSEESFIYPKSTPNQRIGLFCSRLINDTLMDEHVLY